MAPAKAKAKITTKAATTGTVDQSVAIKKAELEQESKDRAPLLYTAIGLLVLGVLARVAIKAWPAIGNGLMLGAAIAGVAWKVAEIPWWAFLAVIAGALLIVLGYKRAEWDKNKNGIPDALEK